MEYVKLSVTLPIQEYILLLLEDSQLLRILFIFIFLHYRSVHVGAPGALDI